MVPEYEKEGVCRATDIRMGKRSFFISGGVAPLSGLVSVPAAQFDMETEVRSPCGVFLVFLVLPLWMSSDLGDWTKEGDGSRI